MNDFHSDDNTPVARLRQAVADFARQRDWGRFHTPKNLAMSLAIEAAELMEHFQWLTPEQSDAVARDAAKKQAVAEELADVLCYAFALANRLEIDVASTVAHKLEKNAEKYPVEKYRGYFGPDDPALES
ncbi:MAG: nucleotide pyrophosphohydrolase [Planctomycetota bacterium]|nr:MAG: nucleotide pyrophosphohydrolase [Planctomycetota bacterium]